ncbi:MAG TPA: glycosyltransferase family 1 protein [Puia sp.]|uniref:glycosyltransferase family 4 protein n=1 Tax=Puia sp. TaxID=2045100 RepID=UPI002C9F028D|nr:glycosyltransferase family 1 protein [Puia sp.]HVU98946.1 glycosyltransferase family 1 protein [Puia sp.]
MIAPQQAPRFKPTAPQRHSAALLFRRPVRFFSLERVFRQLEPDMRAAFDLQNWVAPRAGGSPMTILANWRAARKCRADVYHVTGDIHYVTLALPRRRTMLTIHDCIFLYSTTGMKRRVLKWLFLTLPVRHCRLITAISQATKDDIIAHTGCDPDKIVVIPNPVDGLIRYEPTTFNGTNPAILFIGSTPNKNLPRVAEALKDIRCRLDIVGNPPEETLRLLEAAKITYTVSAGLSSEAIAEKYIAADIVLFPSTFEGFGLPIVEGQKAGRPVITSNLSPMKEVAASGACLVDPHDPASIRAGVIRVIEDTGYREQLVRDGFANVQRFATSVVANQYLTCYKQLLSA